MNQPAVLRRVRTSVLEVAYEESGLADGIAVLLMHGFPYDPRTYDEVVPPLVAAGCRVIVPYLRGCGATRFLASDTLRSGQQAALGNDLKELMDALALERAVLAGYDWGGRAATTFTPSAAARDLRPTGASFVDSSGNYGRRIGDSMTPPTTAPPPRSTTRILSMS